MQSNGEKEQGENRENKMVDENEEKAAEEKAMTYNSNEFEKLVFKEGSCEITVKVALSLKKFLMTQVIEKLLTSTVMKEITGINSVSVLEKKGVCYLQTEGVNFDILHKLEFIQAEAVRSNDVQAISKKLGVLHISNID